VACPCIGKKLIWGPLASGQVVAKLRARMVGRKFMVWTWCKLNHRQHGSKFRNTIGREVDLVAYCFPPQRHESPGQTPLEHGQTLQRDPARGLGSKYKGWLVSPLRKRSIAFILHPRRTVLSIPHVSSKTNLQRRNDLCLVRSQRGRKLSPPLLST
jgi:hypothetical protein